MILHLMGRWLALLGLHAIACAQTEPPRELLRIESYPVHLVAEPTMVRFAVAGRITRRCPTFDHPESGITVELLDIERDVVVAKTESGHDGRFVLRSSRMAADRQVYFRVLQKQLSLSGGSIDHEASIFLPCSRSGVAVEQPVVVEVKPLPAKLDTGSQERMEKHRRRYHPQDPLPRSEPDR